MTVVSAKERAPKVVLIRRCRRELSGDEFVMITSGSTLKRCERRIHNVQRSLVD